jgi:hypothetical protein
MVEYCDTPETERREQTGNTKHTYTLEASSLLDHKPQYPVARTHARRSVPPSSMASMAFWVVSLDSVYTRTTK